MARQTVGTAEGFGAFYATKPASYFSNARADFVDRLAQDPSASILEAGCGTGATGALALSKAGAGVTLALSYLSPPPPKPAKS